jgi:hypothetical protein
MAQDEVIAALTEWSDERRSAMAVAARTRVLSEHTAAHRARELEQHLREAIAAKPLRGFPRTLLEPSASLGGSAVA